MSAGNALRLACEELADALGTCPYDYHSLECAGWEDDCEKRCTPDIDMAACWERYYGEVGE